MALLKESEGRTDGNSAYCRIFGDEAIGALFSRVHAAAIRAGYELEALLKELLPRDKVRSGETVRELIQSGQAMRLPSDTVAFQMRAKVPSLAYEAHADVVIFNHLRSEAFAVELKEGDSFDTKKAAGERESLIAFSRWLAVAIDYRVHYAICCFHQRDAASVVRGLKGKFGASEVLTGPHFCSLLGLDYEEVLALRKGHQQQNLARLADELVRIPALRRLLLQAIAQESWLDDQGSLFIFPEVKR